jgi:excisionase family DNA binding protein
MAVVFVTMPADEFQLLLQKAVEDAFERIAAKFNSPIKTEELMSMEETCKFFQVSRVTIQQWKKSKKINAYRIGRKLYFKKHELISSMDSLIVRKRLLN